MTLSGKMQRLADIQKEIKELTEHLLDEKSELESEIKSEVLQLGQTIETDTLKAKYSNGRGKYDWEQAVKDKEPDNESEKMKYKSVLSKFTKITKKVDYTKIAKELDIDGKDYYTAGNPSVSIVFKGE